MATIIQVLAKFLQETENLHNVHAVDNEFYFQYGKHFFSIANRSRDIEKYGDFSFYVYPDWTDDSMVNLSEAASGISPHNVNMVVYHSKEYPETRIYMAKCYKLLEEKAYNVDKIFKDIVGD